MLRAGLWYIEKNLKSATKAATNVGKTLSFVLMLIGLLYLFFMQFISGMWLLILGFFLHEAAELSYQQLLLKKTLVGTKIKDVMTKDVVTVPPDMALDKIVNEYFYKYRHLGFPVAKDGYLKGMIIMQDVKRVPSEEWDKTTTSAVMKDVRPDLLTCPTDDALDALVQVTKSGLGKLLVVEKGKLCGIVTQGTL